MVSGEGGKAREHKTSLHVIRAVVRNEGITGLYTGLSAGLLRQASYTTVRMGVYTSLFDMYSRDYAQGKPPGFLIKAAIGMTAGAVGAFFGTPAEVSLIRMTSDGRLPAAERRGYRNVFDALLRISREEGVLTLWRGCIPTIGRAMVVNAAQLASYSQAKQSLLASGYFRDNIGCHFAASMISGLITTAASMPVDIGKSIDRSHSNQPCTLFSISENSHPKHENHQRKARVHWRICEWSQAETWWSIIPSPCPQQDVLGKVMRNEGLFALWKGFTPYYARLGPHTVLTFIFLEQMNKSYKKYVLGDTTGGGGL